MEEKNEQPTDPPGDKPPKKRRAPSKSVESMKRAKKRATKRLTKERKLSVIAAAKRREQFLELYRKHGKRTIVARIMGISLSAINQWCFRLKGFREEIEAAHEEYCERLEEEARRRACDGVVKDVYHHGEVVGQETQYSDKLLIKLLEGAKPGRYRRSERTVNHTGGYSIDVSGKVTVAVTIQQAVEAMEAKYGEDLEAVARNRLGVMLPGLSGAGHDGATALGAVHGPAARGRNGSNGNGHHKGTNGSTNGHH